MVRLGHLLYRQRTKKRLTLEDVERAIKIKAAFIAAIERGDYHKLPSPAYAKGFVINYAQYLGFSKAEVIGIFRREFDEKRAIKVLPDSLTKTKSFPLRRVKIQESFLFIGMLIVLFAGFLLFQYRSAIFPPALTVSSPKEGGTLSQEVTVSGTADSDATVLVNNQAVSVDSKGAFVKKLTLFPGKTIIEIKAKNRFGKETTVTRDVVIK